MKLMVINSQSLLKITLKSKNRAQMVDRQGGILDILSKQMSQNIY